MRSFTGILAASCRALRTSRNTFVAANVSLVAFGPVGEVALIVIIGVAAFTVDGTAAAVIGSAPPLQVVLRQQATPLELADDGITGGKSGVDIDQTREATRIGQ